MPQQSDKLLECHSGNCKSGNFFHLTCLGYKKMLNNSKTTWQCNNCKKMKTKSVDASSNVSAFTSVEIAQETTACPSSHDDQSETNELASVNDSDIEEESGDDVEVTMVTTCESERCASLKNLDEQDYQLINAPNGWLDCSIIQSACTGSFIETKPSD